MTLFDVIRELFASKKADSSVAVMENKINSTLGLIRNAHQEGRYDQKKLKKAEKIILSSFHLSKNIMHEAEAISRNLQETRRQLRFHEEEAINYCLKINSHLIRINTLLASFITGINKIGMDSQENLYSAVIVSLEEMKKKLSNLSMMVQPIENLEFEEIGEA